MSLRLRALVCVRVASNKMGRIGGADLEREGRENNYLHQYNVLPLALVARGEGQVADLWRIYFLEFCSDQQRGVPNQQGIPVVGMLGYHKAVEEVDSKK